MIEYFPGEYDQSDDIGDQEDVSSHEEHPGFDDQEPQANEGVQSDEKASHESTLPSDQQELLKPSARVKLHHPAT